MTSTPTPSSPLLGALEAARAANPGKVFFRFEGRAYTYEDTRAESAALAVRLRTCGTGPGDAIAIDLPNCPELVFALFAVSELGASVFLVNNRLAQTQKDELLDGFDVGAVLTRESLAMLPRSLDDSGLLDAADGARSAEDDVFVRMFTSGTSGAPKAARLSYRALLGAARAANEALGGSEDAVWQLALPMFHIGGLQIMLRSLIARGSFVLYERYDPALLIADRETYCATHISVVEKMARELFATDAEACRAYRVMLLGGGAASSRILELAAGSNLFVSYGMTETCSMIAASRVDESEARGMRLLPGYEVRIADPDADGYGEILVHGPGAFSGYEPRDVPAGIAPPAEAWVRTGDLGRCVDGFLTVRERVSDLFVSGGENVYPREIEREIIRIPGVTAAAVIGVEHAEWGRRPIAFVAADRRSGAPPVTPDEVSRILAGRLAGFQRPDRVFVVGELPATALGKTDRAALRSLWDNRIEIVAVNLYRIRQPLTIPFRTSKVDLRERESIVVEVIDRLGRKGYGEDVAFETDWYTDETLASTRTALVDHLVPTLLREVFLHPREIFASFSELPDNLMAKGSIEPACWDLYGRITGQPFTALIGSTGRTAAAGVSLGIAPIEETLERITGFVARGYRRVKLKIEPGDDLARLRAVRAAFPDLMLMADANQSYATGEADRLRALDELGLACIEEPLASGDLAQLSALQKTMRTPICLDESIRNEADLERALAVTNLRCINLKVGKFGGVTPSLDLYRRAQDLGITLWVGGMYETGVSKYLHAQFETLDGLDIPGDISESRRYFERDIVIPEVTVRDGDIVLPDGDGLGFEIDFARVSEILVEQTSFTRG